MTYLGRFTAGASVFYGANFHSDQGTLENPTSPAARLRTPAGSWSDLTAPAEVDSKTGFFGGTIDTSGFADGQYTVRMSGTVTTAKDVATMFAFEVGPSPQIAAIKAQTDLIPASPAAVSDIPTSAAVADKILGRNLAGGSDGGRTVTDALRPLRNKVEISGVAMSVKQEDDVTEAWAAELTVNAAAQPITAIDPA